MLYIHYNQTKPNETAFEYAIQGNNDVDVVCFDINDIHLDFTPSHIYAKVQSKDKKYTDKIELTESNGVLNWHLLAKTTRHKVIYVQLSFETTKKYFQTEMVELTLKPYINAEQKIENDYPMVLQDLQRQIDEMGGGGGATSVEIEKVWLTYDDRSSIRSDVVGYNNSENNFVNDSTRIWVNFKTTPISAKMEEEIKNGRFIIRLDYPNKNRSQIKKQVNGVFKLTHQPQAKNGVGSRSYSPNFLGGTNPMSGKKKQILLNSLIFVNEEDIKVNRYGEKYVHKKVSFYDYVNNICKIISSEREPIELSPITNEWINNDNDGKFVFADYLDGYYACGIPHTYGNGQMDMLENNKDGFSGAKRMKMYVGASWFPQNKELGKTNSAKLNPAFTCYCLLKTPEEYTGNHYLYSPYFIGKKQKTFLFSNNTTDTSLIISNNNKKPAGKKVTKKAYMSAKPRCAILNDDYENSSYAFLKTYPQSEQQIRLYCKNMLSTYERTVGAVPIFRMIITQK